jgi:hypothetical protein
MKEDEDTERKDVRGSVIFGIESVLEEGICFAKKNSTRNKSGFNQFSGVRNQNGPGVRKGDFGGRGYAVVNVQTVAPVVWG